jgi:hypothetical protein
MKITVIALRRQFLFLVFVASATPVWACGVCAFEQWSVMFPPTGAWSCIAPLWFLAQAGVASYFRLSTPFQPRVLIAVIILPLACAVAMAAVGPLTLIPLMVPPAIALAMVTLDWEDVPPKAKRFTQILGALTGILLVITAVVSYASVRGLDRVGIILRYPEMIGNRKVAEMRREGPSALPELRRVVREAKREITLFYATSAIGEIGDPTTDVPLLIETYRRVEAQPDRWSAPTIQEALKKLSGLDLPREATSDDWRKAWEARKNRGNSEEQKAHEKTP